MAFTGKEGGMITVEEAKEMISRYRTKYAIKEDSGKPSDTLWVFSGREAIQQILDQEGCVGIRFYFSENQEGHKDLVMIGVDKDENDMVKGKVADRTVACPPACGSKAVQLLT